METILVLLFIALILYGVCKLLESIPKSLEQKRETQRKNREIELEPTYKELYDKLKHTYDEYLNRPEYRKVGFPTVTIDRTFLHCDDIDDRVQLCSYDLWKNDENLCCVISWKNLDERANAAKHTAALMLTGPETSLYQSEQEMRTYFARNRVKGFYIPLSNIEYFSMGGQKYATTEITGGGGKIGGSSLTGAVVGGVVAGEAGAIIGSRKQTTIDPIQSHTRVHDETEAYIKYKDQNGILKEIVSDRNADGFFNALKKVIPEKEYAYILSQNLTQPKRDNQVTEGKNSVEERLIKAKELLEKGLITQEEYDKKRQDILSEM